MSHDPGLQGTVIKNRISHRFSQPPLPVLLLQRQTDKEGGLVPADEDLGVRCGCESGDLQHVCRHLCPRPLLALGLGGGEGGPVHLTFTLPGAKGKDWAPPAHRSTHRACML